MKKLLFLLLCLITTQLSLAQLPNPGLADGPRGIIPTQAKPEIVRPTKVIATPKCNCGTSKTGGGWDGIGFYVGEKPLEKYSCGYQFTVKTSEKIKFASGGYNCVSTATDLSCKSVIIGTFYKDDTLIRTMNPFNFSSEFLEFASPGNYRLELIATCKGKKCAKCVYYFTVL
jgi:hypothetical protein